MDMSHIVVVVVADIYVSAAIYAMLKVETKEIL